MIDPILFTLKFIFDFWWLIMPALMWQILWEKFKDNQRADFRKKIKWSFLEIKFPSGVTRTPRAMEEVFNSLHAIAPSPSKDLTWFNLNIRGFTPPSYCLIIIAHDGQLKFYLRFPENLKEFVKSRIYSQYHEIKFIDSDDPLSFLPPTVPNPTFEFESFDVRLAKEDSYPIKTYVNLERLPMEQQIDPITTFSEGAQQVSSKEWLVFQFFILPTTGDNKEHGNKWTDRGKKLINKLIGKEEKKEPGIWPEIEEFIINLLLAPFRKPVWKTQEEKPKEEFNIQKLTPGEREILELIQKKISKLGYWCNFRVAYLASVDIFKINRLNIFSLIESIFKNFATENANSFNVIPVTQAKEETSLKIFHLKRNEYRFFRRYRLPRLSPLIVAKFNLQEKGLDKAFILNSEELASIFHPPMTFVPPTGIEKISARELPPSPEIPLIE
ncbi:MAG: hypothetical protein KatS3mg093_090 [Candidatus Parcubacteria bacterium]|nr:MAG: hypothetical protein KatS3mg093_090 [Candidatus Parcubacteria bacterium]